MAFINDKHLKRLKKLSKFLGIDYRGCGSMGFDYIYVHGFVDGEYHELRLLDDGGLVLMGWSEQKNIESYLEKHIRDESNSQSSRS